MSTDAITLLRHRMIEDMNAGKLCAGPVRAASSMTVSNQAPAISTSLEIVWPAALDQRNLNKKGRLAARIAFLSSMSVR